MPRSPLRGGFAAASGAGFSDDASAVSVAEPTISSAPTRIAYGQGFTLETPDAGTVTRGTLIRAGSVTHAFNETQLIIPLTFTRQGPTTLGAGAPANGITAPPGP
ncbi:MAG: galactose oxidase-like domain-containing protein [Gemmatimonadales bacterium]